MIIKSRTLGIPGENIWLIAKYVVAVTAGVNGLAIVYTIDGKMHYLTMKAEDLLDALSIHHEPA